MKLINPALKIWFVLASGLLRVKLLGALGIGILLLVACTSATAVLPDATPTTATLPDTTPATQESQLLPLSEAGPFGTGTVRMKVEDPSRDGRKISIHIWYPAVIPEYSATSEPNPDVDPDLSGAPYPLLLMFSDTATLLGPHLASHGFVVAGLIVFDSYEKWDQWLIDYPLDILFALDQIASNPPQGLEGIIDTDHAGATGYSFDGYVSLALSGARVDPDLYLAQCAHHPKEEPPRPEWWFPYMCDMTAQWDEIVAYAGEAITSSEDGLWQPITDQRIRAVMPMATEGFWWFGERGLAAVDRPTLILVGSADEVMQEDVYIFEHLGTADRAMISFVDKGHMMILRPEIVAKIQHFAVAFFGYHLQGREEWSEYFSENFVAQYNDLAWGQNTGE